MKPEPSSLSGKLVVVVFMLAMLAVFPVRGETNSFVGQKWALVDAKPVMAAAAQITPAKYPDCDEVTVDQKSVREYHDDGTGECQDETFLKVLTEKGKRDNRTIVQSFMLPYTTVSVPQLEVIKPDGRVVPVNIAANSKESIDAGQMSENIYDPNMRLLLVNIPNLEVGDVIHSVIREIIHRSIIPGQYAEENIFEGSGFIRHITYEVYAPTNRPLKSIALRDPVPGTVTSSIQSNPGRIVYRWEVNDVPRMYDEPDMPPYENVLQRLFVSTLPNWTDVSKWYWNLSLPHLDATTPAMKHKVEELTDGATNQMDKIKALFYFVSNQIRYMGITPEKDRPGFEPHDVSITFNKRYGVCRDKAGLLVAMLRLAGFKAYPVLINVGTRMDPDVPDPFFNHAIVAASLKDGSQVLMDPTDENTRELLPAYDRHQSYLVCRPDGATIQLTPVQPADENMMQVKTTATLNANGSIDATSELSFQGVNDDEYRNAFANMRPEDIRRFFERNLEESLPGARLESFQLFPTNLFNMASGLRAVLHFTVPDMTASGGGKSLVTLPWLGRRLGIVNFILNGTGLAKRKYPLDTQYTCGLHESISLKWGKGYAGAVAALPGSSSVNDDSVSYQEHFEAAPHSIECSRTLSLNAVEFSPKEYLDLKHVLQTMANDERKAPLLALASAPSVAAPETVKPPAAPETTSDAVILESHKELHVTGPQSAVYRVEYKKRILTYKGKIQESQVRIPYNPACEEARLVHAIVTSLDGKKQTISPDEINVMDQAWNASAKRYTGGRILVASLPGVEIGSTIDVAFEVTMTNKPFLAGFEPFQFPQDLRQKSFTLTAPAGLKILRLVSGAPGIIHGQYQSEGTDQKFEWQAQNVGALPSENSLPPEWTYAASVGYFVGNVTNYLESLEQTMRERSQHSTEAAALARQLAANAKTRLGALKAIRDYVAKSIRLAGPAFTELPLDELSDADETFADGYGHAADRAILLYAMLQAADFQPQFVLASELPAIAGITNTVIAFPMPQQFQTPLVMVALDGVDYYLNDTDQYAELGTTAHDGRLGLALAGPTLEVIHAAKECENGTRTDFTFLLNNNGRTVLNISRRYYGEDYNEKRRFFAELRPEERDRYFQEAVSKIAQGARALGKLKTDFDSYPGREQFMVAIDDYGVPAGKYFYFDLPLTLPLIPPGADQRTLPLYLPETDKNIIRTEVDLPPDFRRVLLAPQDADYTVAGSETARIHVVRASQGYIITSEFLTSPAIISPEAYQTALKVESDLARRSSKTFLLEQK